jgi:hypothetical protein
MAKLTRVNQKIFGSSAPSTEIGKFGSLAAGSPVTTTDPVQIQALSAFLGGWSQAIVGAGSPAMEDMNALFYLYARQLAYLFERGIPEWETGTTYYSGCFVSDGAGNLYTSLVDNNTGNAVTNVSYWKAYTTGSGSGGGGSTDLLGGLTSRELGSAYATAPGELWDDFNVSGRGTLTNFAVSSSALRFSGSNITANLVRSSSVSPVITRAEGVVVASLVHTAPDNTAVSSNTFVLSGDFTNLFAVGKNVQIASLQYPDGAGTQPKLVSLFDPASNLMALFPVSSVSYNSGTDKTTLVLTNSSSLDLSMGLSAANYMAQLRIIPFDYQFYFGGAAATFEAQGIYDAGIYEPSVVRIPAENYLSKIAGSLSGSAYKTDAAISKSGQYVVVRVNEKTGGNNLWHWFGSSDYGKTFTEVGSKSEAGTASEEFGGSFALANSSQIGIANNGRFVSTYHKSNSQDEVWAITCDLSVGAGSFADIVANGLGVTGKVVSNGVNNFLSIVAVDQVDCSFFSIPYWNTGAGGNIVSYTWVSGTQTWIGTTSASPSWNINYNAKACIVGSGSTHRCAMFVEHTSGILYFNYVDQSAPTTLTVGNSIQASTEFVDAQVLANGKAYVLMRNYGASTAQFGYASNVATGSPSFTVSQLSILNPATFNGYSANVSVNGFKTPHRIVVDPSDDKHVFLASDFYHPDGIERAQLYELCDLTSYVGASITQYSLGSPFPLRNTTAETQMAMTFTGSATRVRTLSIPIYQTGTIPAGSTLTCSIYNTSSGLPTTLLASSTTTYDASKITKNTSGQWCHFNFPTQSLTGVYAFVLTATYPVSASNYLTVKGTSSNPYAGGNVSYNNGSVWAATGSGGATTTWDWGMEVNGEYVTDAGQAVQAGASYSGFAFHDQETQIELIDSTTAALVYRRTSVMRGDTDRPYTGHPFRRVISIGSGGSQSTLSTAVVAGYQATKYDPYLFFQTANGSTECGRIAVATGVVDTTKLSEENAGIESIATNSYNNVVYGSDAAFQTGTYLQCNGSNVSVEYASTNLGPAMQCTVGTPMIVEAEIKSMTSGTICSLYNHSGGVYGWAFEVNSSDQSLMFLTRDTSAGDGLARSVAGFVGGSSYYRVRMVYDGTTMRLYKNTSSVGGTWGEASSYITQTALRNTTASPNFWVGRQPSVGGADEYSNGKIGYVKFAKGVSSFVNDGYYRQNPITGIVNLGSVIVGEFRGGQASATAGVNFIQPAFIPRFTSGVVDSYDQIFRLKATLTTPGSAPQFKIVGGRVSTRDNSSFQGYMSQFDK